MLCRAFWCRVVQLCPALVLTTCKEIACIHSAMLQIPFIIPAIVMHACDCFVSETDHMSLFSVGLACRRSCLHAHCYPFTVLQQPITRDTPLLLLQLQ